MNAADVVTEFGAYYLNHGQGRKDLNKILHYKGEFDELFTTTPTDDTVIRKGSALMTRLLQPFQKTWSPTGDVTFTPSSITLFKQKVDFQDYPDELEETWLGFLADRDLDRKAWPFVKWLIEEHIVPRLIQDHELSEVYAGAYAAPGTPGTAGAAGTAMDGAKTIINAHIATGGITPIATGALSATPLTFVNQVEAFADAITPLYRTMPMNIAMNHPQSVIFKRGMREKYNTNYDQSTALMSVMDYPNLTIKGYHAMGSSGKLIATPKENAIRGVKRIANLGNLRVENIDRQVKIYNDFSVGVGYVIPELVFTNNVETV
jgi:hypothetical protein